MDPRIVKQKAVLERIAMIEAEITKAREFLETGEHAAWHGFRPLFVQKDPKQVNGECAPPHRDWVRNVFIPRRERALARAERALERLQAGGR